MGSSRRDIDVQLGELAIAMETRVHGGVSMDVATGANDRSPLDRRSLWERLATVSPADGTLPIDAPLLRSHRAIRVYVDDHLDPRLQDVSRDYGVVRIAAVALPASVASS